MQRREGQGLGYCGRFGLLVTLDLCVLLGKIFFENGRTAHVHKTHDAKLDVHVI